MKRSLVVLLMAAFAALSAPANGSAQAILHAGGGVTIPMGDFADYASTGWLAHAGVGFPVGDAGLGIGAAGFYGSNSHDVDGDKTNLYGGLAAVQYSFGAEDAAAMPFVFGMAGLMVHSYKSETQPAFEGSETGFAAGGGAGVTIPAGSVSIFGEGWLLSGFFDGGNTTLIGITAGLQFPVGGGGM